MGDRHAEETRQVEPFLGRDPQSAAGEAEREKAVRLPDPYQRMAEFAGVDLGDLWDVLLCDRYPEITEMIAPRATAKTMIEEARIVAQEIDLGALEQLVGDGKKNAAALGQLERARPHVEIWKRAYAG